MYVYGIVHQTGPTTTVDRNFTFTPHQMETVVVTAQYASLRRIGLYTHFFERNIRRILCQDTQAGGMIHLHIGQPHIVAATDKNSGMVSRAMPQHQPVTLGRVSFESSLQTQPHNTIPR